MDIWYMCVLFQAFEVKIVQLAEYSKVSILDGNACSIVCLHLLDSNDIATNYTSEHVFIVATTSLIRAYLHY